MASQIDATKPVTGNPTTQSVRDNFSAAKDEIEALQTDTLQNAANIAQNATDISQVTSDLADHEADTANPHQVTAAQAGADPSGSAAAVQSNLDAHEADTANPHQVTVGQIGAEPAFTDAGDKTVTSTGATTPRTLAARAGAFLHLSDFASLNEAVTEIGATEATLYIDTATAPASNVTVPETMTLLFDRGGAINPASGVTVTINGHIEAGRWQIFGGDGDFDGAPICEAFRIEWFGGVNDGTTDNTDALNAAAALIANASARTLKFGVGDYSFASKPDDFTTGIIIEGENHTLTNLVRDYSAPVGPPHEGFLTWRGGGTNHTGIRNCRVLAGENTENGALLSFEADGNDPFGGHFMDQVWATHGDGNGDYFRALQVDGSANDGDVGSHGARDFVITNCLLFHGDVGINSAAFINTAGLMTSNVWANGSIAITGGGTSGTNSVTGTVNLICHGTLNISNSSKIHISGSLNDFTLQATSSDIFFAGLIRGTLTDNGTDNTIVSNLP